MSRHPVISVFDGATTVPLFVKPSGWFKRWIINPFFNHGTLLYSRRTDELMDIEVTEHGSGLNRGIGGTTEVELLDGDKLVSLERSEITEGTEINEST